jgi:hypothetical protein
MPDKHTTNNSGRGWHGDPDGHADAGKQAHENCIETKWRHFKEWVANRILGRR